jgi:CBS domain-containing protein
MQDHGLSTRITDFLIQYPPFSYFSREDLDKLAHESKVKYYMESDYVFRQDEPAGEYVFVLNKGSVELIRSEQGAEKVIDICDDGDLFGIRSFLTENPYLSNARVVEDTLIYAIPKQAFFPYLEKYPRVSLYFASGFAAGQPVVRGKDSGDFAKTRRTLLFKDDVGLFREEDVLQLGEGKDIICGLENNTVQEIAEVMAEYRVGSLVVINEARHPVGIVTDTDFTRKVMVRADLNFESKVTEIMSRPVVTISPNISVADAILNMMRNKIRHLVVTEDGTARSPVLGVISERDILLMQGNNPAILVKRIMKTHDLQELADIRDRAGDLVHNYLKQEISMPFVAGMVTEINDALIRQAIEISQGKLAAEGVTNPGLSFAWLSLGSEGRAEQLLRTDQDNALLYEDPAPGQEEAARKYFLRLGEEINDILAVFGFAECPAEVMARNPKWNLPLAGWKKTFDEWIYVPEPKALMHGAIFFDFRCGYGDESLTRALSEYLYQSIEKARGFMRFFAKNALENPPPLSFFRNFIVERGGEHKNKFDIKLRGMMPLADAARVLALQSRLTGVTNTFERFEKLAELEPQQAELFEEAAMAYEMLMRYRALNGFENNDSGRYIDPEKLNKIERKTLKYSFRTIDSIQGMMRSRFDLNIFG